jgi:primosomal protein N''
VDQELKQHLEALRTDVKESLERQIENLSSRFDAQGMRLDRQAAMLQTGARWTNRMIAWSEKVDVVFDKRIQELDRGAR